VNLGNQTGKVIMLRRGALSKLQALTPLESLPACQPRPPNQLRKIMFFWFFMFSTKDAHRKMINICLVRRP
jgi:hypothetical protein